MQSWTLTDVEKHIWQDHFQLNSIGLGLIADVPWSITKSTLHGGLAEGVDVVNINNGALSFSVLPTRGMGIWRGEYQGLQLGWQSPVTGPVHPAFINLHDWGGLGWLQGFDEWIVRCGLSSLGSPCQDGDAALTLHGRIANLPASKVEIQVTAGNPPELSILGVVDEGMLFFPQLRLVSRISTVVGSNRFTISDEITNLRGVDAEFEILYHCNFGRPFLEEGARLAAPSREVAPRTDEDAQDVDTYDVYEQPTAGKAEQVYWHELNANDDGATLVMLRNAAGDKGAVLRFDKRQLPYFVQWKNTAAEEDGYVTGLEPGTNLANAKPFERASERIQTLAPGESHRVEIVVEVCASADAVQAVEAEIAELQAGVAATVHPAPIPKYSPVD